MNETIIANESKTVNEYARRVEAWAAAEAKPPRLADLVNAGAARGWSTRELKTAIRQATISRLATRNRLWRALTSCVDLATEVAL